MPDGGCSGGAWDRRGSDRMVVKFTTTYAISAYHHWCCACVRISIRARCTTLCDKVCLWLATDRWFFLGTPVSSTNKTDRHDITEILLKVALYTLNWIICVFNRIKKIFITLTVECS